MEKGFNIQSEAALLLAIEKLSIGTRQITENPNHPLYPRKFGPDGRLYLISKNEDGTEKLTDFKAIFEDLLHSLSDFPIEQQAIANFLARFPY